MKQVKIKEETNFEKFTKTLEMLNKYYNDFENPIKINEFWYTIRIETHYDKDTILEGYLNTINYGNIFGIENVVFLFSS